MIRISPDLERHFKGYCSSSSVIMLFVYMKCRFSLSYRDLEELMSIRGGSIDHELSPKVVYGRLSGDPDLLVILCNSVFEIDTFNNLSDLVASS